MEFEKEVAITGCATVSTERAESIEAKTPARLRNCKALTALAV
jgi:hypothetical protein